MKISKVNHVRTAVSVDENGIQGGILYDSPIKDGRDTAEVDMTGHIEALNQKAQSLYSILNPLKKQYTPDHKLIPVSKEELLMRKNFGMLIKFLIRRPKPEDPEDVRLSKQKSTLFGIHRYQIYMNKRTGKTVFGPDLGVRGDADTLRKLADEITERSLRRSFRRVVTENGVQVDLQKVTAQLLFAMTCLEAEKKGPYIAALKELSDEEILAFFKALYRDYAKKDQLKAMEESIRNQNVRVQPVQKDGRYLLQIAGGDGKRSLLFTWMQQYAAADKAGKEAMIREFRLLLILYYCGPARYERAKADQTVEAFSFGDSIGEEELLGGRLYDDMMMVLAEEVGEKEDNPDRFVHVNVYLLRALKEITQTCYKQAMSVPSLTDTQRFFVRYIEDVTERLLIRNHIRPSRLRIRKLAGEIFREWTSYVSVKFIDLGKAVYHFALPDDLPSVSLEDVSFGALQPAYEKGFSSFDYERIKADETIQRNMSGSILFAVGNFGRSAFDADLAGFLADRDGKKGEADDVLYVRIKYLKQAVYKDATRRILRFFGGMSNWAGTELYDANPVELVLAIRDSLRITRNHNFHYTSSAVGENHRLIKLLCAREYMELGRMYRRRWYSNNVLMFYTNEDITRLMDELYRKEKADQHHTPGFQRLFRDGNELYTSIILPRNPNNEASLLKPDSELMMQYHACLFFLLKEVYYFSFLQQPDVIRRVMEAFDRMEAEDHDRSHTVAMNSFRQRISILGENAAFQDVCELLITDVNMQNNNMRKQAASEEKAQLFAHFKVLLYNATRRAFVTYMQSEEMQEVFGFLLRPFMHGSSSMTEAEFASSWSAHTFDYIREIANDELCLAWYVTGHFLGALEINMLIGKIRGYLTFLNNVDNRAASIHNKRGADTEEKILQYGRILKMLQFTKVFVGQVSQNPYDYYANETEYARYLSHYLDFTATEGKEYEAAREFHKECCIEGSVATPYFVGGVPAVNRNIVFAQMYGNEKLLGAATRPITVEEVREYLLLTRSLRTIFNKKPGTRTEEETREYHRYAKLKNRLELHNIVNYSIILNSLYAQLISWAYLRERDLMYMQLGYAYVKLFWTDAVPEGDVRRTLMVPSKKVHIKDGALLYEIAAMNMVGVPMFVPEEETGELTETSRGGGTGAGVIAFCKLYTDPVYREGLELFMDVDRSFKRQVEFRNRLDHFAYFNHPRESMIRMYGRVFDEFFSYDTKLKKSVSIMFRNILLRYSVVAQTRMNNHEEGKLFTSGFSLARSEQDATYGLQSDVTNCKILGGERIEIPKWDDLFMEQLRAILEYKEA
ncbi:MAG: type VI-A CRISPR-associated RNA-guided ribonuclease Cas13a [Lachnospiraceae bacterium]|nr:type VI-A CRISPR-associated RNA-guided ribonuclease Cas13a [Lachnospiraceae bacterium]